MSSDAVPTLHAWAGGDPAFRRLVDAFYDRVEGDDLLSPLFPGGVSEAHRAHVTTWWVEVFGGRADYTAEHGGYARMLAHHRGLNITGDQRRRFAETMSRAADDAGLPDDPEFRAAFVGYVEWGTRLALFNSQDGAEVVTEAPVPRGGGGWRRRTSRSRPLPWAGYRGGVDLPARPLVIAGCQQQCAWSATPDRMAGERLFACAACGSEWVASQRWTPIDWQGEVPDAVRAERTAHPA